MVSCDAFGPRRQNINPLSFKMSRNGITDSTLLTNTGSIHGGPSAGLDVL